MFVSCLATSSHNKQWLLDIVGRPMLHLAIHPFWLQEKRNKIRQLHFPPDYSISGSNRLDSTYAWDVRCLGSCLFWGPMRSLAKWYQVTNCFYLFVAACSGLVSVSSLQESSLLKRAKIHAPQSLGRHTASPTTWKYSANMKQHWKGKQKGEANQQTRKNTPENHGKLASRRKLTRRPCKNGRTQAWKNTGPKASLDNVWRQHLNRDLLGAELCIRLCRWRAVFRLQDFAAEGWHCWHCFIVFFFIIFTQYFHLLSSSFIFFASFGLWKEHIVLTLPRRPFDFLSSVGVSLVLIFLDVCSRICSVLWSGNIKVFLACLIAAIHSPCRGQRFPCNHENHEQNSYIAAKCDMICRTVCFGCCWFRMFFFTPATPKPQLPHPHPSSQTPKGIGCQPSRWTKMVLAINHVWVVLNPFETTNRAPMPSGSITQMFQSCHKHWCLDSISCGGIWFNSGMCAKFQFESSLGE